MTENIIEIAIQTVLPYIISILELMGIAVVVWSSFHAFYGCIRNVFSHKKIDSMLKFSEGLAIGLEFKMAAEILKTVLIREMSELLVLGAVILLRAFLSLLIRFEMKHKRKAKETNPTEKENKDK